MAPITADIDTQLPLNGAAADDTIASPLEPCTPQDTGLQDLSQVTLPSTEVPPSPIDPNESFKTELNDDRPAVTVIPSSLTPPPSTQIDNNNALNNVRTRGTYTSSQQSTLFSPPATILTTVRDRLPDSDYIPPDQNQIAEASADELRTMLQACVAENQKLKMETAHHKLQYNLLSLQADEDSKRAAVEHDMVRREVDALRAAEHSRQARRELSTSSESTQVKYLQMKTRYLDAMEQVDLLRLRLSSAKKVIQEKEEEGMGLRDERDMLLNRIRENREHFHMLCSPGGVFHDALTPKPYAAASTPQTYRATPRQTPRSTNARDGEHGLSALLQAMSQDNNSAPSTPTTSHRPAPRQIGRHSRNAQSMSSLPTTPMNRRGDHSGLLPSVNLVPQTEPQRYPARRYEPVTPVGRTEHRRRKSRESTISVEDTEELARQAVESAQQFASSQRSEVEEEVFDSQASQAATEMLRRDARPSFEVAGDVTPGPVESSAKMQAKLFSSNYKGDTEKRKFGGSEEDVRRDQGSPAKRMRTAEERRVGLGIQYRQ